MAVAALAFDELTPAQQSRLGDILRQLPDLQPIQSGFPTGAITDRELVMAAATWPDLIKQLPRAQRNVPAPGQYLDNGYVEHLQDIANIAYSDLMHKGWHFVGMPVWIGPGANPGHLPAPEAVNAGSVVQSLLSSLHTNEPEGNRAYQIVWLLHLVGDMHQPLHNAEGCSPTYPKGDTGGNNVHIVAAKKDAAGNPIEIPEAKGETELHAFWDDVLGKKAKGVHLDVDIETADSIEAAALKVPLTHKADILTLQTWEADAHNLAKAFAYNLPDLQEITVQQKVKQRDGTVVVKNVKTLKATISKAYADTAHKVALRQVRLAGHRLALLLKSILGS